MKSQDWRSRILSIIALVTALAYILLWLTVLIAEADTSDPQITTKDGLARKTVRHRTGSPLKFEDAPTGFSRVMPLELNDDNYLLVVEKKK